MDGDVCLCDLGFAPPFCELPMPNKLEFGNDIVNEPVQLLWFLKPEMVFPEELRTG